MFMCARACPVIAISVSFGMADFLLGGLLASLSVSHFFFEMLLEVSVYITSAFLLTFLKFPDSVSLT